MRNSSLQFTLNGLRQVFYCVLFAALISCHAFQPEQKSNAYEVMKSHEIKQLTNAEVTFAAEKYGLFLWKQTDSLSIYCDYRRLDSIALSIGGKFTLANKTEAFKLKQEKDLFVAYQYNRANNIKCSAAIQNLDDKYVIYTVPIMKGKEKCIDLDSSFYMLSYLFPVKEAINHLE